MKKQGVLQLGLQISFQVATTVCNSMYFYNVSDIEQVARIAKDTTDHIGIVYICNLCNYVTMRSLQLLWHYIITTYAIMCRCDNDHVLTNHQQTCGNFKFILIFNIFTNFIQIIQLKVDKMLTSGIQVNRQALLPNFPRPSK